MAALMHKPKIFPITSIKDMNLAKSFEEMLIDKEFSKDLFVFGDNVFDHHSPDPDAGEWSGMRPYNRHGKYASYPRTAGVPIMWEQHDLDPDYLEDLDHPETKRRIDESLDEIRALIARYRYKRLVFFGRKSVTDDAKEEERPLFATSVVDRKVREYITNALYEMCC